MVAQVDNTYIKIRPWKLWSRLVSYALFEGRPLTTRGRWINPLVFAHFALEKRLPAIKKVRSPTFILGTGRSGTTILGIVLSMHKQVGFLNEPKALWHSIYANEDLIGSYSRDAARYRLGAEDVTPAMRNSAYRIFGAYLAATFSNHVVDKYPELIFRVPFVKALFPDAKFLFLVRNGWDTCHSIDAWSGRLGEQINGEVHDWWGADRRKWHLLIEQVVSGHPDLAPHVAAMRDWTSQSDMAAVEWIVTMREGLELLKKYPGDVLRVDYEQLCQEPRAIMGQIGKFIGLGDDRAFFGYAESVLRPAGQKAAFALSPLIEKPFLETMAALGYGDGA